MYKWTKKQHERIHTRIPNSIQILYICELDGTLSTKRKIQVLTRINETPTNKYINIKFISQQNNKCYNRS